MKSSHGNNHGYIGCIHHVQSLISVLRNRGQLHAISFPPSLPLSKALQETLVKMSTSKPKFSFPRRPSLSQYVERALFFLVGVLLHALPRGARFLSDNRVLEYFVIRKHIPSPNGVIAHHSSRYGYFHLAKDTVNISQPDWFSFNTNNVTEDISQNACPVFSRSLDTSTFTLTLNSWWISAADLSQEILPQSHWSKASILFAAFIGCKIVAHIVSGFRLRQFSRLHACLPVKIMPNPFPWKLKRYFELSKLDANLLDEYLFRKYKENGLTHGLGTVLTKRVKAISTIESANFKAVLSTNFDDWERPAFRAGAARPFLKTGILTLVSYILTRLLLLPIFAALFWLQVLFRLTML